MSDVPETPHEQGPRGRLTTAGRSTEDGSWCTLQVVQEADDAWTVHVLGASGVRLSWVGMVALAEAILVRAR